MKQFKKYIYYNIFDILLFYFLLNFYLIFVFFFKTGIFAEELSVDCNGEEESESESAFDRMQRLAREQVCFYFFVFLIFYFKCIFIFVFL